MKHILLSLALVLLILLPGLVAAEVTPQKSAQQSIEDLPMAGRYAVSAALGQEHSVYHVQQDKGELKVNNPSQSCRMGFSSKGVEIHSGESVWGLSLASWGYGAGQSPVQAAEPQGTGNRVEYRRGALIEWYVNGPFGLQQGFTLSSQPRVEGLGVQPLRICLDLRGDLTARVDSNRQGLTLYDDAGVAVYRYAGLTVLDADGREASSRLEVDSDQMAIVVDDQGLRYPLMIDPFIQKAKLTASDGAANDQFGWSVSVSGDVVVVGALLDDSYKGSAYMFVKPVGGWSNMTQTAKLTASDGAANDQFGWSVSVSGDVVVVGAPVDDSYKGSAYLFVKPVGGWSNMTQTAKLTASDWAANDQFGWSVSVSGDTVVVGAPVDDSFKGSAYVFVQPVGGWSNMTQTAKLTALDGADEDVFGASVSVSGDTVLVGAYGDDDSGSYSGSVYVFVKPVGGWSNMTQTAKLTASDGAADDEFGRSVSVSGDVVVVGASKGIFDSGSAYVFVKPVGGWSNMTQNGKLTASDGAVGGRFGWSVSLSGDTVVVGAFANDDNGSESGSAYMFVKPVGGWSNMTQTAKLTASDGAANDQFGWSVSVSGDTVLIGACENDDNGSAYLFNIKKNSVLGPLGLLLMD